MQIRVRRRFRATARVFEAEQWAPGRAVDGVILNPWNTGAPKLAAILTHAGWASVREGCWIITGPEGRRFVVDDTTFRLMFEEVSEDGR